MQNLPPLQHFDRTAFFKEVNLDFFKDKIKEAEGNKGTGRILVLTNMDSNPTLSIAKTTIKDRIVNFLAGFSRLMKYPACLEEFVDKHRAAKTATGREAFVTFMRALENTLGHTAADYSKRNHSSIRSLRLLTPETYRQFIELAEKSPRISPGGPVKSPGFD